MNTEEITELTNTIIAAEKRGWNEALEAAMKVEVVLYVEKPEKFTRDKASGYYEGFSDCVDEYSKSLNTLKK